MAELKTKKTNVSVEGYLNAVADARQREDSFRLVALMKEITGEEPRMWGPSIIGFGEYHYVYESGHEGDMCLMGFSPRKGSFSLYVTCDLRRHEALLKKLGKHKAGKCCLYVKKLEDIDLAVLREMIEVDLVYTKEKHDKHQAAPKVKKTRKKTGAKS